jgi:eukaryotic-like serine/threonine-protein kinase
MGRPEDPLRPEPVANVTQTSPGDPDAPTRGYGDGAPEPVEFPAVPGYDILGELGRGGIGVVYKARHVALNRTVAVKLVAGSASLGTMMRFRREAEAVARLQHPNIVQVFEVGSCAAGSFLALEYVEGGTLKERVAGVPQPPREAARMVETLARAVHHAHDRRLIHRDLKPSNVLLTSGGVPKIADFGLARSLDGADRAALTTDFVGTPAYAAPEQIAAQFGSVGPTTDVYSLGVILYELVTGRVPFEADAVAQVLRMVAVDEPVPPQRLRRDCPRDLETICLKCLQKDPGKRYTSAAELADDLRRFATGEPIRARPIGKFERAVRWTRRNPVVAALLGTVFTLLTTVAAVAVGAVVRIDDARNRAEASALDEATAKLIAERERDAARKAEREGKEKLLQSLISEAKASRYSRRVGQRLGTLDAVRKATILARELDKPVATFDELRNLAIAAFALPDLKPDSAWVGTPTDLDNAWHRPFPDPTYRWVAVPHQLGAVSLRRIGSGPDDCGEFARLPGVGSEVRIRWSAGGQFLVLYHWLTDFLRIQVWRIGAEPPALVFEIPRGCLGLVLTPDGRNLIVFERELAKPGTPARVVGREYELESGRRLRELALPAETQDEFAAHHPLRSVLAVSLPNRVAFIDLASGKETNSIPVAGLHRLAWHPHGELLACISGNHVDMWDTVSRRRVARVEHAGDGLRVHFNTAGDVMVTTGWTNRVRLWNPYTGQKLLDTTAKGQFGPADRLCIPFPQADSTPAAPQTVVEAGREYRTLPVGTGQAEVFGFTACSLHPGGRLVAVSTYPGFALIDLDTGSERVFVRTRATCRSVLFEPDGALLVKTSAGLQRWPVSISAVNSAWVRIGPPETVPVRAPGEGVAASADGKVLAAAALGNGAVVWSRETPQRALRVPQTDCRHVALSPDGKLLAAGSWHGRGIKVWEVETGRLVRTLLPESSATIPGFSPDGKWLTDWHGARWRVSDWSAGPKAPAEVAGCAFSPDGLIAAWAKKGLVVLTDAETGRELARLEDPHQDGLNALTFSPDGTLLLGPTSDGFCARVWDLRKIRAGLVELGLDWDMPPYPSGPAAPAATLPLQVAVLGEQLADPARKQQAQQEHALLALWVDPLDAEARLALGESLLTANRAKEASAQFNIALALRPGLAGGLRLRARARYQLGDWDGCLADCNEALKSKPEPLVYWYRGLAHARLGRPADALPDLTTALESYPASADVYLERGAVYAALGKTNEAVADWKRAADLARPTNSAVHLNNIAWRLLVGPDPVRDPKRALEIATMADNKQPGNPVIVNTLGFARYRNGMPKEAIADLERSLKLGRGRFDAFNLFPLALCHAKLGNRAAAEDCFRRAVKWVSDQSKLTPTASDDLRVLRIEAEGVLAARPSALEPAPPPRPK